MREWLLKYREAKGMKHEDVANEAGIHRAYYTMIENGTRQPSVRVAKSIAKVLDFDWTVFFENEGSDTKHKTTA